MSTFMNGAICLKYLSNAAQAYKNARDDICFSNPGELESLERLSQAVGISEIGWQNSIRDLIAHYSGNETEHQKAIDDVNQSEGELYMTRRYDYANAIGEYFANTYYYMKGLFVDSSVAADYYTKALNESTKRDRLDELKGHWLKSKKITNPLVPSTRRCLSIFSSPL
ncbi:uncharacterized protein L201_004488 [Kwoniella dendrophila CBS 6074]|uniref:Uncharacterized protein n=1 Tax=Kwoniella dendrophila CBS 6074 TaxID=1295534 RepID=A0AAX4JWF7_9TREE